MTYNKQDSELMSKQDVRDVATNVVYIFTNRGLSN